MQASILLMPKVFIDQYFVTHISCYYRQYLRSREDTVRYVVTIMTDDGPNDLADELARGEPLQLYDASHEVDPTNWKRWVPDPMDADPCQ